MRSLYCLFMLLLVPLGIGAGPQTAADPREAFRVYAHDVWQVEDGVPQNSIQTITQTRDGYLWLGTETGLVRFSGRKFTVFNHKNTAGLKDDYILSLFADDDGSLWIGTRQGGLTRLQNGRFERISDGDGSAQSRITAIVRDRDHNLLLGTKTGLKQLADGRVVAFARPGLDAESVAVVLLQRSGDLWIGTEASGVIRVSRAGTKRYTTKEGLSSNRILSLCEDRNGQVWIGTDGGGIDELKAGRFVVYGRRQGLANGTVRALAESIDGHLFAGTDGGGLNRLDGDRFTPYTTADGLPTDLVSALFEDREGSLWIGTDGGGLNRIKPRDVLSYTKNQGLSHNRVTSVLQSRDGSIWMGTEGGGLNRLRGEKFTAFTARNGLSSNLVRALLEDRKGNLWVGTDGAGLNIVKDRRVIPFRSKGQLADAVILALAEGRDGIIWIGTAKGLAIYRDGVFQQYPGDPDLAQDVIMALHVDARGDIWVGTVAHGVKRLSRGKITAYGTKEGLPEEFVSAIEEDSDGTLWMGTNGGGLVRFRNNLFATVTSKQGLFEDGIAQVLDDHRGSLWLSCYRGIFRVAKSQLEQLVEGKLDAVRSVAYGRSDGMKNQECTARNQPAGWRAANGSLWFPTAEGVALIDPNHLSSTITPPPVAVELLVANGKALSPRPPLALKAGTEQLEIHYAGLSFLAPEKVSYRYKLEGFDKGWIDAGSRAVAYYTRLPPGSYRFQVVARFNAGAWSEIPAAVTFSVQPRYYQTNTFYAACTLLALAALTAAYKVRIRQIRANEVRFARLIEQRTKELAESQSKFEFLFSDTPLPLFLYDCETLQYLEVNQAAVSLYGYSREEFLRMKVTDIRPQEDIPRLIAQMGQMTAELELLGTWRHRLRNGRIIFVDISSRSLDWHGRRARLVAAQDITARKEAEAQLQRAKEEAEASNRAKSEFLANMSHEIRTPMNGIIGMTELALDTKLNREQHEYLTCVKSSADSLLGIINDILDFSKIEAGKFLIDPVECELRPALDDMMKSLAIRAHRNGLELLCRIEPDVPERVLADMDRVRQVLINLIGNALKFTERGEVELRVAAEFLSGSRVTLRFSVRDTGIGIPPEKQEGIFEAFAQADGSITRRYGGTGLGLTISSRLVQLLGGRLLVESAVGVGSTFHFAASCPIIQGELKAEARDVGRLRNTSVLVVDDNETNRRILREMLGKWQMDCTVAESGSHALNLIRSTLKTGFSYSLILLDAHMPGIDGFSVAQSIKDTPEYTGVPIMMLSSADLNTDAAYCRQLGIQTYLVKPICESELREAVLNAIADSRRARQPVTNDDFTLLPVTRGLRILLAEDNPVNQRLALRLLEKQGHSLELAQTGLEAVRKSATEDFDVVLMDVQMPEMDGLQATAAIRERERTSGKHVPILAVTAHAMAGDRARSLAVGMDGYLSKPIRNQELFDALVSIRSSPDAQSSEAA